MAQRRHSRRVFTALAALGIAAALAYAFWPRPLLVDIGTVTKRPVVVTIDEEGRTQVHDVYVVSTPVAGRLMRVTLEPGDPVVRDETVVARMLPTSPPALDVRTREEAQAALRAAEAALRAAQADLNKAQADKELADGNLARTEKLFASGIASEAALQRDQTAARLAQANLDTARAGVSMRIAELRRAQAQLISFDDRALANAVANRAEDVIELPAPATGVVLEVKQESEITLPAGAPVMEIGDVAHDLEIVAELLSSDAVRVRPGARVIIDDWGGADTLDGAVARIAPRGFTKYSALGVEEQRVKVTIRFTGPPEPRAGLGHGFRVTVRIVVWEAQDTLAVPSSSLFRARDDGAAAAGAGTGTGTGTGAGAGAGEWAVFTVGADGRAQRRIVEVAANNGVVAAIGAGLDEGERIVLYPSAALTDGARVAQRTTEG